MWRVINMFHSSFSYSRPGTLLKGIAKACIGIDACFVGALVIGYLCFNVNLIQVVPWFWIVALVVFLVGTICAIGSLFSWDAGARTSFRRYVAKTSRAFSIWRRDVRRELWGGFWWKPLLIFLGAVILILVAAIGLQEILGGPGIDLELYFESFLSFLK